jgi:serine/threonine protein kinase
MSEKQDPALDETLVPPAASRTSDYPQLVTIDPQHYVIGKEIAKGGMGRIFTAHDRRLGRSVAIKELLGERRDLRERFEREARITARLQHPSIVSIHEAGQWPNGEPFFAMKLVAGRSLDAVIAEKRSLGDRLSLLPAVIAAVDALAYAHAQRIIHRDLKPANILIGEYGETVVIDWGLAKDLVDTSVEAAPAAGPFRQAAGESGVTVAGAVMGTPAYMPLEQAQGAAVDERADVYALGAILYHVLAGEAPYVATRGEELLARVLDGPPPPLGKCTPGVPADLVAIVEKAMARRAGDRYPSAKALAEELKRFQTGQLVGAHEYSRLELLSRWIRRNRAAVTLSTIFVVLLGVGSTISVRHILRERDSARRERSAAVDARAESDQRRVAAEKLVDFMLFELHDRLRSVGRLELLAGIGEKILAYYDALAASSDAATIDRHAQALMVLGDVEAQKGNFDEALQLDWRALAMRERISSPSKEQTRNRAANHQHIGDALLAKSEVENARAEYDKARKIIVDLLASDPDSLAIQRDLSSTDETIGNLAVQQADYANAFTSYQAALATDQKIAASPSSNDHDRLQVMSEYMKLGDVKFAVLDFHAALDLYRQGKTIVEQLAAKDPKNAEYAYQLAMAHQHVGYALYPDGFPEAVPENLAPSLAEQQAASAILTRLSAADPENTEDLFALQTTDETLGQLELAKGDTAGALRDTRAGLAIAERLVAKEPDQQTWVREESLDHNVVAQVELAMNDLAGAERDNVAALEIMQRLADRHPQNVGLQRDLAVSHDKLADVESARGDHKGALAHTRAEVDIVRRLLDATPGDAQAQSDVSDADVLLGRDAMDAGATTEAVTALREALALREKLAAGSPNEMRWQLGIAQAAGNLGEALGRDHRDEAKALLERAIAILEPLAKQGKLTAEQLPLIAELKEKLAGLR